MDYSKFWQLQSLYRPIYPYTPVALDAPTELAADNDDYIYGIPQENLLGFNYGLHNTPHVFPWMSDPSNILYDPDTKMYHRWGLYRADGRLPGSWVEHVALSINGPWKQTQNALPKAWLNDGVENGAKAKAGWTGGSTFIDWNGAFGYGKGTLFFLVSLAGQGKYNGNAFSEIGAVAFAYAPAPEGKTNGLGAPVRKGSLLAPRTGGNTTLRVAYDSDHKQFLWIESSDIKRVSGTNHIIQIWGAVDNIHNWRYLSDFETGFSGGVTCPNFNKIKDAKTGKTTWMLTCSKQVPGGKDPRQSVITWVGSWNGKQFTPTKKLTSDTMGTGACQLEYGSESYAPSVNDPYGYDGQRSYLPAAPETLYWSTYLGNWAESVWTNPAYGYAGGTWETRGLKIDNGVPMGYPLLTYTDVDYQYQHNLHTGLISFPVKNVTKHWTSRLTMHQTAELEQAEIIYEWSNGNRVTMTWKKKRGWVINRQQSGLFVYRNVSNNPMPNPWVDGWCDLIIHYDNSQFVFWDIINGRVASFWIFPDDTSVQDKSVTPVELNRVSVHVIPSSDVGVDYYFGIKALPTHLPQSCC